MARWPDVPAVYGWLSLDRRGNWRLKGERIGNPAMREFIARNYGRDAAGRWFFQNGPQRVYVALQYTPLVWHWEGERLVDHCGCEDRPLETFLDDEGSVLILGARGVGVLDDRDLARYADVAERLPRVAAAEVPARFSFLQRPDSGAP